MSDESLVLADRHKILNDQALDQLFRGARTFYTWEDRDVSDTTLQALYDLLRMGPTTGNSTPARFLFIKGESKNRLKPHVDEFNVDKVMTSPVTVVVAWDWNFPDKLPKLFPHDDSAPSWFDEDEARFTAGFRNGSLQGAYLLMAARALGLDCGPMSGFNNDSLDKEFFEGDPLMNSWRSNFLVNLGYGTTEKLFPRLPRLSFDEAAKILK